MAVQNNTNILFLINEELNLLQNQALDLSDEELEPPTKKAKGRSVEKVCVRKKGWLTDAIANATLCDKTVLKRIKEINKTKCEKKYVDAKDLLELVDGQSPNSPLAKDQYKPEIMTILNREIELNPDGCGQCVPILKKNISTMIKARPSLDGVDYPYFEKAAKWGEDVGAKKVNVQIAKLEMLVKQIKPDQTKESQLRGVVKRALENISRSPKT